jgi:hypothetical protein
MNGILYQKVTFFQGTPLEYIFCERYLPIFNEDRAFVYSVLMDTMGQMKLREKKDPYDLHYNFCRIADALARDRKNEFPIFIGPESIMYATLESVLKSAPFVFMPDFENEKIVTLK